MLRNRNPLGGDHGAEKNPIGGGDPASLQKTGIPIQNVPLRKAPVAKQSVECG
jgi:hypothetical protein